MADEEFSIKLTATVSWSSAVDIPTVSYDRALSLTSDFLPSVDTPTITKDCGADLLSEFTLSLISSPTKDVSIVGTGDLIPQFKLEVKPEKDMTFSLNTDVFQNFGPDINPTFDVYTELSADILEEMMVAPKPSIDIWGGTLTANVFSNVQAEVDRMVLSYLTIPPDAVLSILQYQTHPEGELMLDDCTLEADVTNVIQLEALGTRLDDYLIEFLVKTSETATPSIYKTNTNSPGGIRVVGINNVASEYGSLQQLIAQIVLEPKDTLALRQGETKTVFYECRMSNRGLGLDYRIAPKRERGDKGIFLVR